MKYIIELPEEPLSLLALSTIRGIPKATKIETFEPYIEPDRKAIEDEVWEFAKKVRLEEFIDEEGRLHGYISGFNSYSEAKAKYKAWLKQRDEIRVGDEVEICGTIGIVTRVPYLDEERVHYMAKSGTVYCNNAYAEIKKTGRLFDEVEELLKKMKEG